MEDTYVIRTAGKEDLELIEVLFNADTERHFGDKIDLPLTNLFNDYRAHRMLVHEKDDPMTLLAYSEFGVHPNIPVLSNELWIQWLKCRFCVDVPMTLMNTMFLNFYIYNKHERILKEVLMEVFYREHKVLFLIITRPPKYPPRDYELLEKLGQVYYPINYDIDKCKDLPTIIIIKRDELMPVISFRRALAEDNDDIVEMIDVDSPEMRRDHGDFFIAELLLGTSGNNIENDKLVVTEDATTGVSNGMMWLSEDVDIENFIKNYDLESLGNLVRYTPNVLHTSVHFEVYSTHQQHYTLDRRLIRFTGKCAFLSEFNRLYATFKYIHSELQRGSTYLRKETKTLRVAFDMPARRSHLHTHNKVNPATPLKRACKAFILKNFLLHPSLRMEYAFYYLCAMFSAYPEYDYCVVTVPMGTKISASLSALLQYFMRVPHRPKSIITDEMFLAHRISINTDIEIYPFQKDDMAEIHEFLNPSPRASDVVHDHETKSRDTKSFQDHEDSSSEDSNKSSTNHIIKIVEDVGYDVLYNEKSEFNFFVIRAGNAGRENSTAVGFILLRPFAGYDVVYKHFMLPYDKDNFTFERGELLMLRLHPFFTMWSDEILRTVSLRTGYRDIYYFQPFTKEMLPNDLVSKMMPVEPRRMKRNWFIDTESKTCLNRGSEATGLSQVNFMRDYFYVFRHNLSRSKYFGNQNALVIVGFSAICKALLRLMIFGWNTPDFKNVSQANCLPHLDVTVIVNHGEVESEFDRNTICQYCSIEQCYLDTDHNCPFVMDATKRLDLRNWVNFVPGEVKFINRAEKTIQLDNSCKIGYEKLLLLCDTQYGLPPEVEEKVSRNKKKFALPYNYVEINSRLDKVLLYFKLCELVNSNLVDKNIVIYGCNLTVYECIHFILNHDCKPSDIIFVQPHKICQPEYENNPTEDENIQYILLQMVCDLGIKIYESSQLEGFEVFDEDFHIQTVQFVHVSTRKRLSLKCNIFINFFEMHMSVSTERMLRDSRINIKDRKIVVDENFCTEDPNIFAAGKNVTVNVPVFYQYANTSELEMAEKLLDIMQLSLEQYTTEKRFSRPKLFQARLPLGYLLVKVIVPKRYMLSKLDNTYSYVMSTFKNGQFCRIRMNSSFILEEITCVVRNVHKDLFFLEYFVGKHDLLLNHLGARFKNGFIDDFISYFEEPWTEIIMHDRFPEMQSKNRDTLISLLQQKESGRKAMNIGDSDFKATCKHFVEANLLKFLRTHRCEFTNEFVLPEDWESFD